jgi:hypothetical protein
MARFPADGGGARAFRARSEDAWRRAVLGPAGVQGGRFDLIPTQVKQFARPEAVSIGDQHNRAIPAAMATPIDRETAWGVRGRQAAKQKRAKTNRSATVGAQQELLCQHAEARCPASLAASNISRLPASPVGNMIRATATRSSKSWLLGSDSGKTSHR